MSTPIRLQYLELKQRYPDTILFFRLGDFYETFDVYSEFADLPELIPRWISRMWFDAAHVLFIFNTSNDNPMLASSFSNAGE